MPAEQYRWRVPAMALVTTDTTADPLHCQCTGCELFRVLAQAIFGWMVP